LNIASQQVGDELGGVEALRATGAFAEVTQLAAGGYWLLARPTYGEYDMTAAEKVFQVVAPKLPAGRPIGLTGTPERYGPPALLVDQDAASAAPVPAADVGAHASRLTRRTARRRLRSTARTRHPRPERSS
jgi:hypothetical protein